MLRGGRDHLAGRRPAISFPHGSRDLGRGGSPGSSDCPELSVLGRIVRAVTAWRARARADAEARRSMFYLARLDDHTLRDIGLNRAVFYCEGTKPRCYDF